MHLPASTWSFPGIPTYRRSTWSMVSSTSTPAARAHGASSCRSPLRRLRSHLKVGCIVRFLIWQLVESSTTEEIVGQMARKLKTYETSLGFFDPAIAAPSMKAALDAWGADSNLFHQGAARQSEDPNVIAATMEMPGFVLKRPVGSTGPFQK